MSGNCTPVAATGPDQKPYYRNKPHVEEWIEHCKDYSTTSDAPKEHMNDEDRSPTIPDLVLQDGVKPENERSATTNRMKAESSVEVPPEPGSVPHQGPRLVPNSQPQFAFNSNNYSVQQFVQQHDSSNSQHFVQPHGFFPTYGYIQALLFIPNLGPVHASIPLHYQNFSHYAICNEGDVCGPSQVHCHLYGFVNKNPAMFSVSDPLQEQVQAEDAERNLGRVNAEIELAKRVEIVHITRADSVVFEIKPLAQMLHEEVRLQIGPTLTLHEEGYLERVQDMDGMTEPQLMAVLGLAILGRPPVKTVTDCLGDDGEAEEFLVGDS